MPTLDEVDTLPSVAELFQHHSELKRIVGKLNTDKAWKIFLRFNHQNYQNLPLKGTPTDAIFY